MFYYKIETEELTVEFGFKKFVKGKLKKGIKINVATWQAVGVTANR